MIQTCNHCGDELPMTTEFFYRDVARRTGFKYTCIPCCRGWALAYHNENKDKINARKRVVRREIDPVARNRQRLDRILKRGERQR